MMPAHHDMDIDNASTESLQRILQMSRQEHEQKPGAVRMPGYQNTASAASPMRNNNTVGTNNNNNINNISGGGVGSNSNHGSNDYSDINPRSMDMLVSMGFTVDQVVHALRMNAYDVQSAAQYLLGGA
jgi:aspartokinase